MRRITPIGLFILAVLIFTNSGIDGLALFFSNLWLVIKSVIGWMIQLALTFPEELGLIDAAYTWIIYLTICILCFAGGIYLTKKEKGKLFSVISFVISAISLLLSFIGMISPT